jgi:hypothetical protein
MEDDLPNTIAIMAAILFTAYSGYVIAREWRRAKP